MRNTYIAEIDKMNLNGVEVILSRPKLFENVPRTAAPNGLCVDHWIACHLRHTFNYGWRSLCVLTPFTRCTGTTWHFVGNKRFLNGLVSVWMKHYTKRKRDFTSITLLLWAGPSARIYYKRRRWIRCIFLIIIYFRTSPRGFHSGFSQRVQFSIQRLKWWLRCQTLELYLNLSIRDETKPIRIGRWVLLFLTHCMYWRHTRFDNITSL